MLKASHLRALLKKNLLISKSTFILTALEIFSPLIIMLLLWGLKTLFDIEELKFQNDMEYIINNGSLLTNHFSKIMEDKISYRGWLYLCQERLLIAFVGENFPEELKLKFRKHLWEQEKIKFKDYNNLSDLLRYVESKEYGTNNDLYPKLCFAVSFKNELNKYIYKLHYFASPYKQNPPDIPSTEMGIGDILNLQPDFTSYARYIQSGFFMSQKVFYDYVLQKETGNHNAEITYIISPKKYDKYVEDSFVTNIGLLLTFFTIVAYAMPLTINVFRIVKEKENRAKEGMKIMGLNELTYFLSYFIIYFIINLIYSIGNAFILKNVITYIETIYIFLLYFLYGLVVYALIYFFQSFLERTRIAVIVSLLIYALMYFISIPVFPGSVSKGIKIVISIFFPPVALQLGINTLSLFEEDYNKFNGRIYYDYNNFNTFDMYITFIISFFLFMFIGFYLQNILSHEYGIKKPFYFLCTKNFWGYDDKINKKYKEIYTSINENLNLEKKEKSEKKDVDIFSSKNIIIDSNYNNNKEQNVNINDNKNSSENQIPIKNETYLIKSSRKAYNSNNCDNGPTSIEILIDRNNKNHTENKNELIQSHEENNIMKLNQNDNSKINSSAKDTSCSILNFENEELFQINNKKPTDILRIQNIHKIFEDGKKALNGVSFNLYKNEIFALLGHNGAGKSTLINILTGLYPTTAGSAIYNNENIITSEGLDDFRKFLGICPQHDVLFDNLTVEEHLEMFCVFKSVPRDKIENEITKIIEDFNLASKRKTKACNLSGGQKRKL